MIEQTMQRPASVGMFVIACGEEDRVWCWALLRSTGAPSGLALKPLPPSVQAGSLVYRRHLRPAPATRRRPKMLCGVGLPRAPALGVRKKFDGARPAPIGVRHRSHHANVGGGECVRLAHLAHDDVLGGPFADAQARAKARFPRGRCRAIEDDVLRSRRARRAYG